MSETKKIIAIAGKMDAAEIMRETGKIQKALTDVGQTAEKTNNIIQKLNTAKQQSQGQIGPQAKKMQESSIMNQMQQNQNKITEEVKYKKQLNSQLQTTQQQLSKINKINIDGLSTEKEKKSVLSEQNELLRQEVQLRNGIEDANKRHRQMGAAQTRLAKKQDVTPQEDISGAPEGSSGGRAVKMFTSALTGVGVAVAAIGKIATSLAGRPLRYQTREAGIATGSAQEQQALYSGGSAAWEESYYSPEKFKAMDMAKSKFDVSRRNTLMSALGDLGTNTAVGAGGGAMAGAFGGGIGALPGALLGGAAGLVKGGVDFVSDDKKWAALTNGKDFNKIAGKEFFEDYRKATEEEKQKNMFKMLNQKKLTNFFGSNLSTQRSLGLDDYDFKQAMDLSASQGFSPEETLRATQSGISAGGSTRMARLLQQGTSIGYERNFNQQNASSVLGKISGNAGDQFTSKNMYVQMMAEGTRLGLNTSDLTKEMESYNQQIADLAISKGITSQEGVRDLTSQMSLGDKTMAGVRGSITAFEKLDEQSGTRISQIAAINELKKIPGFEKLSPSGQMEMAEWKKSDWNVSNPMLQGKAAALGLSPDKLQSYGSGVISAGLEASTLTSENKAKFDAYVKETGLSRPEAYDQYKIDRPKELEEYQSKYGIMLGLKGQSFIEREATIKSGMIGGEDTFGLKSTEENTERIQQIRSRAAGEIPYRPSDKMGDKLQTAGAKSWSVAMDDNFGAGADMSAVKSSLDQFTEASATAIRAQGNLQLILDGLDKGKDMGTAIEEFIETFRSATKSIQEGSNYDPSANLIGEAENMPMRRPTIKNE